MPRHFLATAGAMLVVLASSCGDDDSMPATDASANDATAAMRDAGPTPATDGAAGSDAGPPAIDGGTVAIDGGMLAIDGGTLAIDGGTAATDGGTSDMDAGTIGTDAGTAPLMVDLGADRATDEGSIVALAAMVTGGAGALTFDWDFGDGDTSPAGLPTEMHVYRDNGTYTVVLNVTDGAGGSATDSVVVTAANVAPAVTLEADTDWAPGLVFRVDTPVTEPSNTDVLTATIDWGDGSPVEPVSASTRFVSARHAYLEEGTFIVTLSVSDDDGGAVSDTQTLTVTIHPMVILHFELEPWAVPGHLVLGQGEAESTTLIRPTFSLTSAPVGAAIDASTGQLTWTPTDADVGDHVITVQATAGAATATVARTITIATRTEQASAMIGPAGGVVEVTDVTSPLFGVRLDVPAGALTAATPLSISTVSPAPPDDPSLPALGPAIELGPDGTTFAVPVDLTVPFDAATLPPRITTADAEMHMWVSDSVISENERTWIRVPSTVDTAAPAVHASLAHFTTVRIWGATRPGHLATTNFDILYATRGPLFGLGNDDRPGTLPGGPVAGCTYRADTPDYIDELGCYLEQAFTRYQTVYGASPSSGSYVVDVRYYSKRVGLRFEVVDGQGVGDGSSGIDIDLYIHNGLDRLNLQRTAAHELFHCVQLKAFGVVPSGIGRLSAKWLLEATAEYEAQTVFPPPPTEFVDNGLLRPHSLSWSTDGSYGPFVVFDYLELRTPSDLVRQLFGPTRAIQTAALTGGTNWFYNQVDSRGLPDRNQIWRDFAFAYHSARADSWLAHGSSLALPLPAMNGIPPVPIDGTEACMPRARTLTHSSEFNAAAVRIDPGNVDTFVLDFSRVTAIPAGTPTSIVLSPTISGGSFFGSVYVVPAASTGAFSQNVASGATVRYDLDTLRTGKLVVTFYNPHDAPGSATVTLRVWFERVEVCGNGMDDDCDGIADAVDPDCSIPPVTFTTCGATGIDGPTAGACTAAYAGTPLASVTVTSGIQHWTVPLDGTYRIDAYGAQGASGAPARVGGRGARVTGDFMLTAGQVLDIVVGQRGLGQGLGGNGGGGGGSFVARAGAALVVAGGGGGARLLATRDGFDAVTTNNAVAGNTNAGGMTGTVCAAGVGGGGGGYCSSWGSGGGGFTGSGMNDVGGQGRGGASFVAGARGGDAYGFGLTPGCGPTGDGGFGGGGGYSGGGGGWIAGGGGSFNAGASPSSTAGARTGDGTVIITRL